ncbi:ESX-1 secretion-associated protein EspI [Mus musculus]|uniref:ESX-1 secretion-associated protein EspI n=1 Tax=Mus musculus TaxID=10090 RepID=UPI0003D718FB|nr:ESX-1 secretion-associated protein EspI [Mus musculus]|eukprot:XP_017176745.1 PREDICTED: ESX-1 secretion-associated protein EspI-like [Mus musculus]
MAQQETHVTVPVSEHVRDNPGRAGGNAEHPASGAAATFNPGFSFRAQKWCPEAATFASALLLPPPTRPPSPPPRAGRRPGTRAAGERRNQAGGLPTLKPPLQEPTAPLRGLAPVGALWELAADRVPPGCFILAIPSPTCALLCTTRAGHPPPHAAFRSPCRKGSALHARTHSCWRRQPARTMFPPHQPRHQAHTPDGCREPRSGGKCPLPTTTPTAPLGPRTHLQPTAAAGTSRGGQ